MEVTKTGGLDGSLLKIIIIQWTLSACGTEKVHVPKQSVDYCYLGLGVEHGRTANGRRDFWGADGNVLKLDCGDDYTTHTFSKNICSLKIINFMVWTLYLNIAQQIIKNNGERKTRDEQDPDEGDIKD